MTAIANGVSVIIPTTCIKSRERSLHRAVSSAFNQSINLLEVVLIVNGEQFDRNLFEQFKADSRLSFFYLPVGNVSQARYHGIILSKYDCFVFLDDDDELLPNTLKGRYDLLNSDENACLVVSNGYFFDSEDHLLVDDAFYSNILESNEASFLNKNWFASPSVLYGKSRIDVEMFNFDYKYFEMTYIFFKIIEKRYKLVFSMVPAYRCYADTLLSASKSDDYMLAYPAMIRVVLNLDLSIETKKRLKRKYVVSLNVLSDYFIGKGKIWEAWIFYIRCLLSGGFDYLLCFRKFLRLRLLNNNVFKAKI